MVDALKDKPQADDPIAQKNNSTDNTVHTQCESFGPGSDLVNDHPDMCITTVNNTHHFVINKFPVFRPMLLLLTVDSYRRQYEPLDREDLEAAWDTISGMEEEHYVFFNCSVTAGSSREHKHLQVIPAPGSHDGYPEGFKYFPDYDVNTEKVTPSFVYFLQRFRELPGGFVKGGEQLLDIYFQLLRQTREALGLQAGNVCPHNFVLTKRWMLVVPRRAKVSYGLTANSAGMVGSVYLWTRDQLDTWTAVGPGKVVAGLGLPQASY